MRAVRGGEVVLHGVKVDENKSGTFVPSLYDTLLKFTISIILALADHLVLPFFQNY